MTTLTSKNNGITLDLPRAKAFNLADGDMLIIGTPVVLKRAMLWLMENGVSNVFFDPADKPLEYCDFSFVTTDEDDVASAIRLYS